MLILFSFQVLSWLSSQGLFPLEYIVHVDPDFFKKIMPEVRYVCIFVFYSSSPCFMLIIWFQWKNYVGLNREFAGTACHQESAYLQEIASEVAMRDRQHVWVDGSLSDGPWYSQASHI